MVKTTFEMDGLFTQEDIDNRHKVVFQCQLCNKWTPHDWIPGEKNEFKPCDHCGDLAYDRSSIKSLRTFRPEIDNKRKIKTTKKR